MTNGRAHETARHGLASEADESGGEVLTHGPALQRFLALETAVWQALAAGDAAADAQLLSEDFLGVYPSGFSDRAAHCSQLDDGPVMAGFTLSEARLRVISQSAVLLSYKADYRRTGTSREDVMYISSLWQKQAAGWINTFSQDTPADRGTPEE